jgi:hypothetical protein
MICAGCECGDSDSPLIADESHITGVLNTFKLEISEPAKGNIKLQHQWCFKRL